MSVASVLKFNINTFLNSQGFQQFKSNFKAVYEFISKILIL